MNRAKSWERASLEESLGQKPRMIPAGRYLVATKNSEYGPSTREGGVCREKEEAGE